MKMLVIILALMLSSCATQQGYFNPSIILPDQANMSWSPNETNFNMKWE